MKAVFLDRDGTIAKDVHYCRRVKDFEILPTVPEAIKLLNENGFKVIVITNQSGIARGYFTEETLSKIHQKMINELSKYGARIDAIYYCPHHPDDDCSCRKPKTALFHKAAKEHNIDFSASYVVGDRQMDIDAGRALGCRTILVNTGPEDRGKITDPADYTADTLLEAVQWIIKDTKLASKRTQRPKRIKQTKLTQPTNRLTDQPTTTIIIPAYNEEEGLPVVLNKIFNIIDKTYEVIVVDDGSDDKTYEVASQFPCRAIKHRINKGKGEALKTGIKHARGKNIIWIDADDTYPPELIPKMAKALKDNYDMVVGSRYFGRNNIPLFNRLGNWLFRNMIKTIYGFKAFDPCTGLYGVKKYYLEKMHLSSRRFAIEPEISIKGSRMKLRTLDIPTTYHPRIGGSKLSAVKVGFEDLKTIISHVFWFPAKEDNSQSEGSKH